VASFSESAEICELHERAHGVQLRNIRLLREKDETSKQPTQRHRIRQKKEKKDRGTGSDKKTHISSDLGCRHDVIIARTTSFPFGSKTITPARPECAAAARSNGQLADKLFNSLARLDTHRTGEIFGHPFLCAIGELAIIAGLEPYGIVALFQDTNDLAESLHCCVSAQRSLTIHTVA
jgi:hypothetical protein